MNKLKNFLLQSGSIIFLQVVISLIAIGFLAFLIWEPSVEGVNVNKTLFQIYFNDPVLAYIYLASVPFFVAIYNAIKLLENIKHNETFSKSTLSAVRYIKYCAIILVGFLAVAAVYLSIFIRGKDDVAGGLAMCVFFSIPAIVAAATASVFEKALLNAIEIKSENDLTI